MPLNKDALFRYICYDHRLRRSPKPSLEDLRLYCMKNMSDDGANISQETVRKDLAHMRNGVISAPVAYDAEKKGYYYQNAKYTFLNLPLDTIDRLFSSLTLQNLIDHGSVNDIIQFETSPSHLGLSHLPLFVNAIKRKRIIMFDYKKPNGETKTKTRLVALRIKEHRNSWYVLGHYPDKKEIRMFQFGRIMDMPELTDEPAEALVTLDMDQHFFHTFGIMAGSGEVEKVELKFTEEAKPYVLNKPLHHSQRVLSESKDGSLTVELQVWITIELVQAILSYGGNVKVLSPKSLVKQVKNALKAAIDRY